MKARDVMYAAKAAFEYANPNQRYWEAKVNNFLRRCGAKLEDGPEQELDKEIVKRVVYAMLDETTEAIFWRNIYGT